MSFGVFSAILYFTGVNKWVPLGFLIGSLVVLTLHNSSYIRRKIFPKQSEEIDEFLDDLSNKSLDEILTFIKKYQLDTNQLIKILNIHKDNYDIYLFIRKYQSIKSELVEYLIQNQLYIVLETDLFNQYLIGSLNHVSKEKYRELRKVLTDKRTIKTLNLCYPFYLKKHSIFKFFSYLLMKIRNSINYGGVKVGVFVLSLFTIAFYVSKNPSMLQIDRTKQGIQLIDELMSNLFALLTLSGLFALLVLFIIGRIIKFSRFILYLFAPDE